MNYVISQFRSLTSRTPSAVMDPTSKKNSPIELIPGIGRHTPKALKVYGIKTVEQFARFTEKEVVAILGNSGKKLLYSAKMLTMHTA